MCHSWVDDDDLLVPPKVPSFPNRKILQTAQIWLYKGRIKKNRVLETIPDSKPIKPYTESSGKWKFVVNVIQIKCQILVREAAARWR